MIGFPITKPDNFIVQSPLSGYVGYHPRQQFMFHGPSTFDMPVVDITKDEDAMCSCHVISLEFR